MRTRKSGAMSFPSAMLRFLSVTLPLISACADLPSGLPSPVGYDGFLELGWQSIGDGRYAEAYEWFEQAIVIDVLRADAYLGAAVSCIYLPDRWGLADEFLQTAVQQDLGRSAVIRHPAGSLVQDTLWTVFECVDKDIPGDSLTAWLELTADSGAVWVGQHIYDYLIRGGFETALMYRFRPGEPDAIACTGLHNGQSGADYGVDSISAGWAYLDVPVYEIKIGEVEYYTWIMVAQNIGYDWAVFQADEDTPQITLDALASWTVLEEAMGSAGDLLQAAACSQGLLDIEPGYRFGEGDPIRDGFFDLGIDDVVADGAALAFLNGQYVYCWFLCMQAGYGIDLDPESDDFLLDLLQLLAEMRN